MMNDQKIWYCNSRSQFFGCIATTLVDLVKWYLVERKMKPLDQHATNRSVSRKVTTQNRAKPQIMTIAPLATKQGPSSFALKKAIGSSTG
jgi:hypothetical protein